MDRYVHGMMSRVHNERVALSEAHPTRPAPDLVMSELEWMARW
jgi:hypothetical protein